jgi:hypothetical protein
MEKWDKIPEKERNSGVAKRTAKLAGMKSMGEVRCAADMDRRGIPYHYEVERLTYIFKPAKYTPDFTLYENDHILIEYKGKMTNQVRKKLLAIRDCNPNRTICLVFEKPNNKLSSRKNSMRYWQWAERNGFLWSEHFVREEWLNEDAVGAHK